MVLSDNFAYVDVKGPGPQGPAGPTGPAGEAGVRCKTVRRASLSDIPRSIRARYCPCQRNLENRVLPRPKCARCEWSRRVIHITKLGSIQG